MAMVSQETDLQVEKQLGIIESEHDVLALQATASDDSYSLEVQIAAKTRIGTLVMEAKQDSQMAPAVSDALGKSGMVRTVESVFAGDNADFQGSDSHAVVSGTVTHTSKRKVRLYQRTTFGWLMRMVVENSEAQSIKGGFRHNCGHCMRSDCSVDADINGCMAREPRAFARCPYCPSRKKLYDQKALEGYEDATRATVDAEDDASEIKFEEYANASPRLRVKGMLDAHLLAKHSQEALALGLRPLYDPTVRMAPAAEMPQPAESEQPAAVPAAAGGDA